MLTMRRCAELSDALLGQVEPLVNLAWREVADRPVGHAQAHMSPRGPQNFRGQRIEQGVQAFGDFAVGAVGMNTESQGNQVEAVVAATRAVPVHDAGDAAVSREDVAGVKVPVHSVIAEEVPGILSPAPGDLAFERGGAPAELAKRLVQAVSGAVIEQVQLVGRYVT